MIQLVVKAEDTVIEGILAAAQAAGPDLLDQKDALKAALFWMEAACPTATDTSLMLIRLVIP